MSSYPAMAPAGNVSTYSAASTPAAPAAVPAGPKVNNIQMVYHADIFILALCFGFVLVSLPRAIARISAIDWRKGHFLRSIEPASPAAHRNQAVFIRANTNVPVLEKNIDGGSDDPHTLTVSHEDPVKDKPQANLKSPPHVPAFSTFLHPVSSILHRRIAPGFSYGQVVILILYSGILGYLALYKSNPISNPERCESPPLSMKSVSD